MTNKFTPLAVLGLAALVAPAFAQDPMQAYKQIQQMADAGQFQQAEALSTKMLTAIGDKNNRAMGQFAYLWPFFAWQQAEIQSKAGNHDKAVELYKNISERSDLRSPAMMSRAKNHPGASLDYQPFLTASLFKAGYERFQQATGTAEKPGDPKYFAEAITYLDRYLKLLQANKVTPTERSQRLDGQVCFLLFQCNVLKPEPEFTKATEYMELSRKARGGVPDDMAIQGLSAMAQVGLKTPSYIEWVGKLVNSSPESYKLGPVRSARYAEPFMNYALQLSKEVEKALVAGDTKTAAAAAYSSLTLFGLVPDSREVITAHQAMIKAIGKSSRPSIPDQGTGATYVVKTLKPVMDSFVKLSNDNMSLDGLSIMGSTDVMMKMGSNRLAKAGFQLLNDRYPRLSTRDAEGNLATLRNGNLQALAQLCEMTGDSVTANRYFDQLAKASGGGKGGDNAQFAVLGNKLKREADSGNWAEVIPVAEELIKVMGEGKNKEELYQSAEFSRLAAFYMLQRYDELLKDGEALVASGRLTGKVGTAYDAQLLYFMADAANRLGAQDPAMLDKSLAIVKTFQEKHPSTNLEENSMAPNIAYLSMTTLMRRASLGNEQAAKTDNAAAVAVSDEFAANWPAHALYAPTRLLAGNILIVDEDAAKQQEGVKALTECVEASVKPAEGLQKDLHSASNALWLLTSYGREVALPGEDAAATTARIKSYIDRFWSEIDAPGDGYCLEMLAETVRFNAKNGDDTAFAQAVEQAKKTISRESVESVKTGEPRNEIAAAVNTLADTYFTQMQKAGKELTLEQKCAFFTEFPGIDPADKNTGSTLRMGMIDTLGEAAAAYGPEDAEKRNEINNRITQDLREMVRLYSPAEIGDYSCVRLGDYLVDYVGTFEVGSREEERTRALAYFEKALANAQGEYTEQALVGKANALALAADNAVRTQAIDIYKGLAGSGDPAVQADALKGLTKLYMATGQASEAVKTAQQYIKLRGTRQAQRLDMLMLLGQAYAESGDTDNAVLTYMNLCNQNRGQVSHSAPGTLALMELMWKRNNAQKGEYGKAGFRHSDRWTAWSLGQDYVNYFTKANAESQMTPADRDKFRAVRTLVGQYGADSAVQREDRAKREMDQALRSSKK